MKKNKIEKIDLDEKFEIPQVFRGTKDILRGKEYFQREDVASPFHGSHVKDNVSVVDNAGVVDVDYGYDFAREASDKHISDEELIRRHGTKYYEFNNIHNSSDDELYADTNYDTSTTKAPVEKKKTSKKLFSFIESTNDVSKITEEVNQEINDRLNQVEEDYNDSEAEFKLNIQIDSDNQDYNEYDANMPKPSQVNIPNFLSSKKEKEPDTDISYDDNLEFEIPKMDAPNIEFDEEYSNPALDKSQTIEEAIRNMNNNTYKYAEDKYAGMRQPEVSAPKAEEVEYEEHGLYDNYYIPYDELFDKGDGVSEEDTAWLTEKKETINHVLESFGIEGEVVNYTRGPAFTRYEIGLAAGVNVKKVNSIYDNLQLELQAKSLRLLAPIPGKNTIGVEVPNAKADVVHFGDLITEKWMNDNKPLNVALGQNIDGSIVYKDITEMPHCLIAGATKSGKSVCINTILISLLVKNSPDKLKLILVDPKKVELGFYNDLPHLATPVIDDPELAAEALNWAVKEMEDRYERFVRARVRNIESYYEKQKSDPSLPNMPYIVIVVDEFNDLIMQCPDVNSSILRLAQKARAAGMHVILATQRPTTDVVNGTIKANFPCKIAFRVSSNMDSRVILDEGGAENLLGRGDMLIKTDGPLVRAQGAYISDSEITNTIDVIINEYDPDFLFTHADLKEKRRQAMLVSDSGASKDVQESEDLLYDIALGCIQQGMCSINSIQNAFGLGFNRASRIVTILEERGIVSQKNGTKGRDILVDVYQLNQMFGKVNE